MKRLVLVCLVLCAVALPGEEPAGRKSRIVPLGRIPQPSGYSGPDWERFEVYEDWERGYFVYKQVQYERNADDVVSVSITAVPIRSDWPPKLKAEEESK